MNFFEHQDQARKQTRVLLVLFLLAVVVVILLANILLVLIPINLPVSTEYGGARLPIWQCIISDQCVLLEHIPWEKIIFISSTISLIILGGSAYKALTLSKAGGVKIATLLGGEALDIDSKELADKRLFNVVQEMSLAANMPPPSIFVLRNEEGLNAFAAGFSNKDAIVAVTEGLLKALDRDQLQAVIAHEFSHIVHGDSSLNMRLLSVVHGLLCISELGFMILRSRRRGRRGYGHSSWRSSNFSSSTRSKNGQSELAFIGIGIALVAIGYIGVFFGNLIKSAISRQREYLADASAVKYTRHPDAVADALKTILSKGAQSRGSYLETEHAGEMSHFFFSKSINQLQSIFATHPKLVDRIYRVQPGWDGDTTTKSHVANVRRKAREHAKAEKSAKKQAQKDDSQFDFDLQASPLVAALMAADLAEEKGLLNIADNPEASLNPDDKTHNLNMQQKVLIGLKPLLKNPVSTVAIILELLIVLQFIDVESDVDVSSSSKVQDKKRLLREIAIKHWPALENEWKKLDKLSSLFYVQEESLKIVELCLPALRQLRQDEFQLLKKLLVHFIKSDEKIEVLEWCIHRFIIEHLESHFSFKKPPSAKYQKAVQVQQSILVLLHLFIGSSSQSEGDMNKAYAKSCDALGLYQCSSVLPDWSVLPRLPEFSKAITQLQGSFSLLKGKLINVCKTAALQDGSIESVERQILLTLAATWNIPMPDIMFDALS